MYCPSCGVSNPAGATTCRVCGKELVPSSIRGTCSSCGADGQELQSNCTKCGARLPRQKETKPVLATADVVVEQAATTPAAQELTYEDEMVVQPTPDQPEIVSGKWCPQCGRPKSVHVDLCDYCRQSGTEPSKGNYYETSYDPEMNLPQIGGLLILISGLLGVIYGTATVSTVAGSDLPLAVTCFTGLMVVFGLIAIFGGISAMERKNAVYAVLGGVFGLLSIGFYIGSVMSLVGLVLVIKSYNEFKVRELSLNLSR